MAYVKNIRVVEVDLEGKVLYIFPEIHNTVAAAEVWIQDCSKPVVILNSLLEVRIYFDWVDKT